MQPESQTPHVEVGADGKLGLGVLAPHLRHEAAACLRVEAVHWSVHLICLFGRSL